MPSGTQCELENTSEFSSQWPSVKAPAEATKYIFVRTYVRVRIHLERRLCVVPSRHETHPPWRHEKYLVCKATVIYAALIHQMLNDPALKIPFLKNCKGIFKCISTCIKLILLMEKQKTQFFLGRRFTSCWIREFLSKWFISSWVSLPVDHLWSLVWDKQRTCWL